MKLRSLLTYISLFFIGLTLTVSCTNPATYITTTTESAASAGGRAGTSLGYSAWPGWFPWQVAQEQKLFEANKASVALKWFDGYLESINTLTAQQIDANSQTLNDTLSAVSGGADQVVVLVNDNSTGNDKVIVREGINTIADLKGSKLESYFIERKSQLDKVLYSLIQTQDLAAQELYFQIQEGEADFASLARKYSQGANAEIGGLIGPVELSICHPIIGKMLSVSQPGQLWPPTPVGEWLVIVRLEKFIGAQLDNVMRQRLQA